jgi:phosphatidylserine/phosphatidylglycerophosphate/cardiolipin synthase-like enzyme
LTQGNQLPHGWLLQIPDCWGDPRCTYAPGAAHFVDTMVKEIAAAKTEVDITGLLPFPTGGFLDAIATGIRESFGAGNRPLVRILFGVSIGADPFGQAPKNFLAALTKKISEASAGASVPELRIAVGEYKSSLTTGSWNHSKIVAVDGNTAIVGGINYWAGNYLQKKNPVTDVAMQVRGPAAGMAVNFTNVLWQYTCKTLAGNSGFLYATMVKTDSVSECPATSVVPAAPTPAATKPGPLPTSVPVLALGETGQGVVSVAGADKRPADVTEADLKMANCISSSFDWTNDSINFDAVNPGSVGLRALVRSAKSSIFISQQDLIGICPPQALYDVRLYKALATKLAAGVRVTIVVSNQGAQVDGDDYSNGAALSDILKYLTPYVVQASGSPEKAHQALCTNLDLAPLRTSEADGWANATGAEALPSLHSKVVMVDKEAFYIGSQNLYSAYLQEFGYIVDNRAAATTLYDQMLGPEWRYSAKARVIGQGVCPAATTG